MRTVRCACTDAAASPCMGAAFDYGVDTAVMVWLARLCHHALNCVPVTAGETPMSGKAPGGYLKLIREPRQEAAVGADEAAVQVAAGEVQGAQARRRLQLLHKKVVDEGHVIALQVQGVCVRHLLARPARHGEPICHLGCTVSGATIRQH